MSVYIKGMKMPKHCWNCHFHDDNDDCVLLKKSCIVVWGEYRRREDCPLVPVPDHGRLIDADAFEKENAYYWGKDFINARYEDCLCDLVNAAPTIIPAEEDE